MSKSTNNHKDKSLKDAVAGILPEPDPSDLTDITVVPFDGIAFSMQCVTNNGHNNFKILTLTIEAGIVVDIKYSDPYASFEFLQKFEEISQPSIHRLNSRWKVGKCLG